MFRGNYIYYSLHLYFTMFYVYSSVKCVFDLLFCMAIRMLECFDAKLKTNVFVFAYNRLGERFMTSGPLVLLPITCYCIGFVRRDSFFLLGTWYCLRHFIVVLHLPFKLSNLGMEM